MSKSPCTLSLIVVALNEAGYLPRWMESVDRLRDVPGVRLETVLVDGGSSDGTLDVVAALGFDSVTSLPGASIPACRNQGAHAATGDWLGYVDADCTVAEDWLEHAAAVLSEGADIAGWPARPPAGGTWVQQAWALHWQYKHRGGNRGPSPVTRQAFRLMTTRNMIMPRRTWVSLHGFNEALLTGEDSDFAFRAEQAGLKVLADSTLRVTHHGEPAGCRDFFRQQCWHANRRAYPAILRYGRGLAGIHAPAYSLLFLLGMIAVAIGAIGAIAAASTTRGFPATLAWGFAPLAAMVLGPAALIAWRARQPHWIPALAVLYFLYGLARALDLLGFLRQKRSWRQARAPTQW